jgi:hypothetical protein
MRSGKLDAAKAFLKARGYDDIPDEVLIGLFHEIKDKSATVYERNDFVEFHYGMGEMGHGTVIGAGPGHYRVQTWTHDQEQFPSYQHRVGEGDMRGLSTPEKAMEYHLVRSGQK